MPTPVRRQSSSHLYPKSSYAAPSVLPNAMPMLSSTSAPIAPQQAIPANGYQSVNFNTYATPAGRMASGLGYNDPVMAQYLAQQQRNALTPQQRAYVDATPQIMANRMAGEIPPGPRSPQEAAINNVGGTYSRTASDATKAVYQAAAQRQAARMAAYKSLVARRYGGNSLAAPQQPSPVPPGQVSLTYGQNGIQQTPSPIGVPPAPAPSLNSSPANSVRTVPNTFYPQSVHNMPNLPPLASQLKSPSTAAQLAMPMGKYSNGAYNSIKNSINNMMSPVNLWNPAPKTTPGLPPASLPQRRHVIP